MIFPGMDPYLENPAVWPDVHSRLVVYMAEYLRPHLRPRYVAAVQTRVFIEGAGREIIPDMWLRKIERPRPAAPAAVLDPDTPVVVVAADVEVEETYLEILDLQTDQRVVTVLEVVSPTNKYAGPGRDSYAAKQREVRASQAHLVEIDLLRGGPHVVAVPENVARRHGPYEYLACVNRAEGKRETFELYPGRLRQRLPRVRIPLTGGDPDVTLDVQAALTRTYEEGSFAERLAYDRPCVPPLPADDQAWADELIRAARPRGEAPAF